MSPAKIINQPDPLHDVFEALQEMTTDTTVPQNVRQKLNKVISSLRDPSQDTAIRINKVQDELENITSDVNLPSYVRTQIMNISSLLECAF